MRDVTPEPAALLTTPAMTYLTRFGRAVVPVGQGYDEREDAPSLKAGLDPDRSEPAR